MQTFLPISFFFTPNYIMNSEIMFVLCDIHILGENWSNLQSICQGGDFWKVEEGATDSTSRKLWNMKEEAPFPFPDTQTQAFICPAVREKWIFSSWRNQAKKMERFTRSIVEFGLRLQMFD